MMYKISKVYSWVHTFSSSILSSILHISSIPLHAWTLPFPKHQLSGLGINLKSDLGILETPTQLFRPSLSSDNSLIGLLLVRAHILFLK